MDEFSFLIDQLRNLVKDLQRANLEADARIAAQKAVVEGHLQTIRELNAEIMTLKAQGGRG